MTELLTPSKGGPGVTCFLASLSPVSLAKMSLLHFHLIASQNNALFFCRSLVFWKKVVAIF